MLFASSGHLDHNCRPLFRRLGIMTVFGQYILDSLAYVKDDLGSITAREDNTRGRAALTHCKNLLDFLVLALKIFNQLPSEIKWLDRKKFMAVMKSSWLVEGASYFSLEEWFYDDLKALSRGMSHNFLPCLVSYILSCTYCLILY